MHLGNMAIIGQRAPQNFKHIIFNNGAHVSVGGQKTVGLEVDFLKIAEACGYKSCLKAVTLDELEKCWPDFLKATGPSLLEVVVNTNVEKDLPRPKEKPFQAKEQFMDFLKS